MLSCPGSTGAPVLRSFPEAVGALAGHGPDFHNSLFFSLDRGYLSLGTQSTHFVSKNPGVLSKSVKKDFLFAQNQHTPRAFSMAPRAPTVVHESVYPGRAISFFLSRGGNGHTEITTEGQPRTFHSRAHGTLGQFGCTSTDTLRMIQSLCLQDLQSTDTCGLWQLRGCGGLLFPARFPWDRGV